MGYRTEIDLLDRHISYARPEGEWFVMSGSRIDIPENVESDEQLELAIGIPHGTKESKENGPEAEV